MSAPVLAIEGVSKAFGGLQVLEDISFRIDAPRDIVGLVGPNGAGKTTLFNVITGLVRPDRGTISIKGEPITGLAPHKAAARGVSRTFQDTRLFDELTVEENLHQGRLTPRRGSILRSLVRSSARRSAADVEIVEQVLAVVALGAERDRPARMLPHAKRSLLGIGMAMVAEPAVALLDEPFGGMNEAEIESTMNVVRRVAQAGIAVLLVEHVMTAVMGLSHRIEVLNFGQQIASGTPEETASNPAVIDAYLGVEVE
jgi:branched-chain amino acid transport system ATP-binding protein